LIWLHNNGGSTPDVDRHVDTANGCHLPGITGITSIRNADRSGEESHMHAIFERRCDPGQGENISPLAETVLFVNTIINQGLRERKQTTLHMDRNPGAAKALGKTRAQAPIAGRD
jgi:hypothetical protein